MVRTIAIFPASAPLFLAGCVAAPTVDGTYRTTNEAPIVQSSPISADLRAKLDYDRGGPALGRRVALVIGNSRYGGSIGGLANPANDAADIAAAMKRAGFEVDLQMDVSRDEMKHAMLEFSQRLRDSDIGLFYYAGHAVQVNGRNFMIPIGAKLQLSTSRPDTLADYVGLETIEIDDVLGRMAAAEPDMNIVILDACRDNPFAQGSRGMTRGLAQTLAPRGTFVAYATAPGEVAEDGSGKNSPYTEALVETVKTPGLKLEDVFKQVRRKVALSTEGRQTPWENSSIFGDFYFTPPKAPEIETAAPAPQQTPELVNRKQNNVNVSDIQPSPPASSRLEKPIPTAPPAERSGRSSSINTTFMTP